MKRLLIILSFACVAMSMHAQDNNLRKSVEDGIKTSISQTENREWKEAFATCRQMDALISSHEQKSKQAAPELHYLVTKERLRMYMRLNNAERSKAQVEQLEAYAKQAKDDATSEDLLMTKAGYYQKFGMAEKSLECYKQLVQKRTQGEAEAEVDQCYKDMIAQAKESNNSYLTNALNNLYTNWQDSIEAARTAQAFASLKQDFDTVQTDSEAKTEKIESQQSIIVLLCIVAIALAGILLFVLGIITRNANQIKKLKKSLTMANDNNEVKSLFISNIGTQIVPSLESIRKDTPANSLAGKHAEALEGLMEHIQKYIGLENNREERYEVKDLNVNALCESIMEEAKKGFKDGVESVLNVPRVNIRTNAEALKDLLLYLLGNAAKYTEEGKITLEFKKRSAHTGQFIVTDTGCGVPEDKRRNLFKPFGEIHDLTQGDGFGLPTCTLMAYKLNGTLSLDENYKKGARFVLELHS